MKYRNSGFSLVELLLVLAIVAALAVAAFVVYPKVQAAREVDQEAKVVSAAAAGIKAMFTNNDYRNVSVEVASDAAIFPEYMKTPEGILVNRWGGEVTVVPSNGAGISVNNTGVRRYFRIGYYGVPSSICPKLVGALEPYFGTVRVSSVNGLSANGGHGEIVKNTLKMDEAVEFDPTFVAQKCSGGNWEDQHMSRVAIFFVSE